MHPLIQEQLRTIEFHLEDLREALTEYQAAFQKHKTEQEDLQREQFRQRKHQVTISHLTEDLTATHQKLDLYEQERAVVHESLQEVMAALKGLRSALTD